MTVRAKFRCVQTTENDGGTKSVKLRAVSSGSDENKQFFQYTPSGDIDLAILNPAAAAAFKPGTEYFVDFTPAT